LLFASKPAIQQRRRLDRRLADADRPFLDHVSASR